MKMHNLYFIILLLFIVFSCDSFSLREQFIPQSKTLKFSLESNSLKPLEETSLFIDGGVPPYTVNIILNDFYFSPTQASDSGFITNSEKYTAGLTIGTRTLRLRDKSGNVLEQQLTVYPKVPISLVADGTYGNNQEVKISWVYEISGELLGNIESFKIEKLNKTTGVYAELQITLPKERFYVDLVANPDTVNTYRICAIAKNYTSAYVTVYARGDGVVIP